MQHRGQNFVLVAFRFRGLNITDTQKAFATVKHGKMVLGHSEHILYEQVIKYSALILQLLIFFLFSKCYNMGFLIYRTISEVITVHLLL